MDTKHTPGPWTAERLGEFAPESERMIMAEIGHTDTGIRLVRSIARTVSNAGAEQALANARLIAAAPELLQELDRMADNMAFVLNHAELGKWYEKFSTELEQARAAIAKATQP